ASRNPGGPTLFAAALGQRTVDLTSISIATRGKVVNGSLAAAACPWLAGMPNGSSVAATGGNPTPAVAPTNSPSQVSGLSISGGVRLCFREASGITSYAGSGAYGPDGELDWIVAQAPANGINTTLALIQRV